MIDVHSHIVFDVDDGSKCIQDSIEILKEAVTAGINKIILTPHYMEDYFEVDKNKIKLRIDSLNEQIKLQGLELKLYQGNEIYITSNINKLIANKEATTLNDSKYVLFELPMNSEPFNLQEVIYLILEENRIPIIAHPERYAYVQQNPNMLIDLIEQGVLFQSNYGSIIGQYGKEAKKTVEKLIKNNFIHMLGSDVHRKNSIYTKVELVKKELEKLVNEDKIEELTVINPEKIIMNEQIQIENPIKIKKSLFSKFL